MPRLEGIWPDTHVEYLKSCLANGMTFSNCADALNKKFAVEYTRNAIAGRVSRAKLEVLDKPYASRGKIRASSRPDAKPKVRKPKPAPKPFKFDTAGYRCADVEPRLISIHELKAGDCRWPYGDGPFTFCGHATLNGDSYCVEHIMLSLSTTHQRKNAA